jgi:hypothetical protein
MRPRCILLSAVAGAIGLLSASATEWFVSPSGNDSADGRSEAHAWKTLARANRHLEEHGLHAGDAIRLRGGAVFEGSLIVDRAGGGTEDSPARITTFGRGRAVIQPGLATGVLIRETGGISVSGLRLKAGKNGHGDGIRCDRNQEATNRISNITIRDCEAVGFAWHGIMVDASQHRRGFDRVQIEDCITRGNRYAGIMVYGGNQIGRTERPHTRVTIERCVASGNAGDPDQLGQHSGSGILVDGVDEGAVRNCVAFENGAECRTERGGPVGIWAHASSHLVIERCESYRNRSCLRDGGGFDLDAGCEDSVLRWNYSHENHGAGFLVYTYTGAAYADRGCRVYGNISWHDGAPGSGYAGIQIGSETGCRIADLVVANNTIIAPPGSVGALRVSGQSIGGMVCSNLVVAAPHGVLAAISGFEHQLHFVGNRYWRDDGVPVFLVDSQWPIRALAEWRNSTGPDHRFTAEAESFADPGFRVPPTAAGMRPGSRDPKPFWPELDAGTAVGLGAPKRLP